MPGSQRSLSATVLRAQLQAGVSGGWGGEPPNRRRLSGQSTAALSVHACLRRPARAQGSRSKEPGLAGAPGRVPLGGRQDAQGPGSAYVCALCVCVHAETRARLWP